MAGAGLNGIASSSTSPGPYLMTPKLPATSLLTNLFQPPPAQSHSSNLVRSSSSDSEPDRSSCTVPLSDVYRPVPFPLTAAARTHSMGFLGGNKLSRTSTAPVLLAPSTTSNSAPSPMSPPLSAPGGHELPLPNVRPIRQPPSRASSTPRRQSSSPVSDAAGPSSATSQQPTRPFHSTIGHHLYVSGFLNSQLSDVRIMCFGRIYRLHRLVLSQVEFFEQLLNGDWREASQRAGQGDESIKLEFDVNVTRASWEYCLAIIYGGGPDLVMVPWAKVDQEAHLLGRTFALLRQRVLGRAGASNLKEDPNLEKSEQQEWEPMKHPSTTSHFATPSFLLSLLACASYLNMSDLVTMVVSMIQDTLTPFTVLTYLDFAVGQGVSMTEEERRAPCSGLDGISLVAPADDADTTIDACSVLGGSLRKRPVLANDQEGVNLFNMTGASDSDGESAHCVKESSTHDDASVADDEGDGLEFCYGAPAERVGEACACWLAKWGCDVLATELTMAEAGDEKSPTLLRWEINDVSIGLPTWLQRPPLALWGRAGLSAKWVQGVIASDGFFMGRDVRGLGENQSAIGRGGEWERYAFARSVAELRQRQGRLGRVEEQEHDINRLFEEGIYLSHLTFPQLTTVMKDRSSVNGRPFVSKQRIQRALWESEEFTSSIPHASPLMSPPQQGLTAVAMSSLSLTGPWPSPPLPDSPTDKTELGFAVPLDRDQNNASSDASKQFFVVPVDRTCRLNDNSTSADLTSPTSKRVYIDGQSFFGLGREVVVGTLCEDDQGRICPSSRSSVALKVEQSNRRYNIYEPCRFSIEFFNINQLASKQRIYSHSQFYGGSLFNCYLQVVRNQKKSNLQLGLYLHRQSMLESPPPASKPEIDVLPSVGTHSLFGEGSRLRSALNQSASNVNLTGSNRNSASLTHLVTEPFSHDGGLSAMARAPGKSFAGYMDRRKAVQAYFAVHSPNLRGNAATMFASGPDAFANSQSWGYRSSSLLSAEYIGTAAGTLGGNTATSLNVAPHSKYSSLRCTVTIGLS